MRQRKTKSMRSEEKEKDDDRYPVIVFLFEPIPGLEPGTYSLRMNCSTN